MSDIIRPLRSLKQILLTLFIIISYLVVLPDLTAATVWTQVQVNADGFGDGNNIAVTCMATFKGNVWVGTLHSTNTGQVWKYNGTNWIQKDNGWGGDTNNTAVTSMKKADLTGTVYIYVGTKNTATGAEVWSCDGTTWTQVNTDEFGNANNIAATSMIKSDFEGARLYVGTENSSGAEVWRYDGSSPWEQLIPGWGSSNTAARSMAIFNNNLYVGTENSSGAEVWRYDGFSWSKLNPGWGSSNTAASSMEIQTFSSITYLYVGTENSNTGAEVWSYDSAIWAQVNPDGFGDVGNTAVRSMGILAGYLYVGTENSSGAEVWRHDGTNWKKEGNGWNGNTSNTTVTSMHVNGISGADMLYMGISNQTTGAEVWRGRTYNQIQSAINVSTSGSTVLVEDGTYNECITMKTGVDVVCEDPLDRPTINPTVIGEATVTFKGPLSNCTLDGFIITGGVLMRGQIYVYEDAGSVTNATINNCQLWGAPYSSIVLNGAVAPTITSCDISNPGTGNLNGACITTTVMYDIEPTGSPIIIKGNTLHGANRGGIYLKSHEPGGIKITIGGSGTDANQIYDNGRAGIYLEGLGANCDVTIDNNEIYNNGTFGGDKYGGIHILDVSGGVSSDGVVIQRNGIHHNNRGGIRIDGNSNVIIGAKSDQTPSWNYGNDIYGNYGGIFFASNVSGDFAIRGNYILNNSGSATQGSGIQLTTPKTATITISQNEISQNQLGGIGIKGVSPTLGETCTVAITKNDIHDNVTRGGIHTGNDTGSFLGNSQNANFTIKQNKVHHHFNANYGGGVDVRHASGTIKNNLVFKNSRGGIRIGDYVTDVINNTVVWNGFNNTLGGGIVYDDPATDGINDPPDKTYNDVTLPYIRNNICAYNRKAGIGVVFDNTGERDYNLLYDNWYGETVLGYNYGDCSWTGWPGCKKRQLGGSWPVAPNEIFRDPLFVDKDNDDYHLQSVADGYPENSPAIGTGEGGVDMGAYGGPDAIDDNDFAPAYIHCLIDGDTTTGNTPSGGRDLYFDLGGEYTVKHVRLYRAPGSTSYNWRILVPDVSCGTGTLVLDNWTVDQDGWNEAAVTTVMSGKYIRVRKKGTGGINEGSIFEFQFSDKDTPTTDDDWLTPVSTVDDCTDIYGLCKQ